MRSTPLYADNLSFSAYDLQPLLSALASVVVVILAVSLAVSLLTDSAPALFRPVLHLLDKLYGMAGIGLSALLGRTSLGQAEWGKVDGLASGKPAVVKRYRDTAEGKKKVEEGGRHYPGLLNAAGNLCFLNATLQSMASLPPLLAYLDDLVSRAEDLDLDTPVALTLINTLEALNTPSTSRPAPLRPVELANALVDSSPTRRRLLANSDQQDAHELWVMMRDAVEEEAARVSAAQQRLATRGSGLREVPRLQAGVGLGVGVGGAAAGGASTARKKTATDPFFWLRSQRVRCMECGYVRDTRHEEEELLMLSVPPVDLLAEYTKTDLVSYYNCRRCSLLATLVKYKDQRDRLALASEASASPKEVPSPGRTATKKPSNPFELPPAVATNKTDSPKMTTSRKERRRKVQKLVDKVQDAVDAGDWERDLGEEIKVERSEVAAGKMTRFARSPDVLAVHLNRSVHYSYAGGVKNSCPVTFPEYLDISPFSDGPQRAATASEPSTGETTPRPSADLYRVASLVVHFGSHSFGHYVAFRRRPPSLSQAAAEAAGPEWYRVSDETVQPATIGEALRANPYLLFYERVRPGGWSAGTEETPTPGAEAAVVAPRIVESWRANSPAPSRSASAPQPSRSE
ncbi:ubiquitin-specific protease ubp1 [Rhodotorula sphaerocarpa]